MYRLHHALAKPDSASTLHYDFDSSNTVHSTYVSSGAISLLRLNVEDKIQPRTIR